MRLVPKWIFFSVFFSSFALEYTLATSAQRPAHEAVLEAIVSYRPDRVFVPGRSILEFEVTAGAPLLANCTSDLIVSNGINKQRIRINQFSVYVRESNKKSDKVVTFPTPGVYNVGCVLKNQDDSKNRFGIDVIVNDPGNPVNLKTNSPVVAGESLVFTFTFDGEWKAAEKLRLLSYLNLEGSKNLIEIRGSYTESSRTKEIPLGKFTIRSSTKFEIYNGTRIVRFVLIFHLTNGNQKYVELATPVTVMGSISSVTITVRCECSSKTYYNIDVSIREEYPNILRLPLGEYVYFEDHSPANMASSKWLIDDGRSHIGNLYGLRFESREQHKVTLLKENVFGQFEFIFYLQAFSAFENLMVISASLSPLEKFSKVVTVLTSSMSLENISIAEDFNLTTTISTLDNDKESDSNDFTLITQENERKCFDMKTYPLAYYVKSTGIKNVKISRATDKETSYCVWESGRRFSQYGLFTLYSTVSNEIGVAVDESKVCVSVFADCASPSVRIRKSYSSLDDDSIIVHYEQQDDIYQWCDFYESDCIIDSETSGLSYEWSIFKLHDDFSELSNNSMKAVSDKIEIENHEGSELFIPSYKLPVGFYQIKVEASESPFCGDEPIQVTDLVHVKISPLPLRVEIEGGRTSVRYLKSPETRIVLTAKLLGRSRDASEKEEVSSQANYQYLWLCTLFEIIERSRKYFEDIQKEGYLGNLPASNDAGCFGNGYPVLQQQTTSVLYNSSAKKDIIKTPIDSDMLSVPAFQFVKIPAVYSFRLIVWDEELQMAFFDHILDLRETLSSGSSLVEVLARNKSSDVAVFIKCQSNCRKHLNPGENLRLIAECKNCKTDYNMSVRTEFKWTVIPPDTLTEIMDEIFNWYSDSYNKKGVGSSVTLKPSAFLQIGLYTIKVELLARNTKDGTVMTTSSSSYEFHVGQPPATGTCTVRPSSGIASLTRFSLQCSDLSKSTNLIYEMSILSRGKTSSFQGDISRMKNKNSYVFFHGPTNSVNDFMLPIGDEKFGYKIFLRTRTYDKESFSDYFNYITVTPPPRKEVSALLHQNILDEVNSTLALAVKREDMDEVAQIVHTSLSILENADDDLAFQVTNEVLHSLEKITISSAVRAKTTSSIIKHTILAMLSKTADSINSTLRSNKALKIEDNLLTLTSKLLKFIKNEESMENYENINAIAKTSLSSLTNMGQLLSLTDSHDDINSDMINHEDLLYREFQRFLLTTLNSKDPDEDVSEFNTGNAKIAYGKTKLLYESLESMEISQSGFKIDKLVHGGRGEVSGEIEISIARSTFSYDPFLRSQTETSPDRFILPVVGITIGKPILRADKENQGMSGTIRTGTEDRESDINIAELLNNRTLNVLVPLKSDAVFQTSTSVVLPQPCQIKSQSILGFSAQANKTSKCGSIMAKIYLDDLSHQSTSHYKDSHLKLLEETFVVLRSNRACRNPSLPCIRLSFVERTKSEYAFSQHNESSHEAENVCLDDQTFVKNRNCTGAIRVLFTTDLPRDVNKDALDFTEDPWSFPFPATVLKSLQSGVEEENRRTLTILLELLQNDPITPGENEILSYMNITISVITVSCKMWNNENRTWNEDVCDVGHLTASGMVHCSCRPVVDNNSYKLTTSNIFEELPLLFTAHLIAMPNHINFEDIVTILLRARTHYHAIFVILVFWILFLFGFVWAWKSDSVSTTTRRIHVSDTNDPNNSYLYEVVVITAMLRNSGTTAKVTLVLEGDNKLCSEPHVISSSDHSTLQRGARDSFLIATQQSLGQVVKIHIWHDNTGDYPSWHLNRIAVFDLHDSSLSPSYFLANVWLTLDIFPFRCDVVIARTANNKLLSFENVWRMRFTELVETEDIWISTFFRSRYSSFTRVQRLACCAVALFGCILSTLMFYDVTGIKVTIGKVTLDLSPIVISLEAAFIMIPVNFVTMNLFRHLAPPKQPDYEFSTDNPLNFSDGIKMEGANLLEVESFYTAQESRSTLQPSVGKKEKDKIESQDVIDAADVDVDLSKSSSEEEEEDESQAFLDVIKGKDNVESQDVIDAADVDVDMLNCSSEEDELQDVVEDSEDIHPSTSIKDHSDDDNDSSLYCTISEDQFAADDALQCRAIREIAEAIARECEIYRSLRNGGNKRERKVFVRVHEIPKSTTRESGDITDTRAHNLDDQLEDFVETKRKKQKIRRLRDIVYIPKQTFQLPRWVMYIAWTLVVVHILICSFMTFLYGLSFNKSKFVGWLITFFLSLLQNMIFLLPLRLVAMAALSTWLGRKKIHLRDWTAFTGIKERTNAVLRWYKIQDLNKKISPPTGDSVIENQTAPLTSAPMDEPRLQEPFKAKFLHLVKSGKRGLAVRQVQRYLLDASLWIALTIFVTALILIQRDWRLNRIGNRVTNYFEKPFELVKTSGDILRFLDRDIIPVVYKTHEFTTADQNTLIGPIRIRQVRFIKRDDCFCFSKNYSYGHCSCKYPDNEMTSNYYYDSKSYRESWRYIEDVRSINGTSSDSPWINRPGDLKKRTYFLLGSHIQRPFYPAGGYIMDLGYSAQEAKSNVAALKHSQWIDKNTAAIFIEYSLLNPVSGHVTAITYITECLSSGGIAKYRQWLSFRPFYIYQLKDITVILLQLFHLGTIAWLIFLLLSEFAEVRWRPVAITMICFDMWHIFNILNIIATISAYFIYAKYLISVLQLTAAYREDPSQFHQFSEAGYYNTLYFNFLSLAAFFSYIRILKVMRGSRIVSVMTDTLMRATTDLGNTTLYIAILVFGFTMLGNFTFGTHAWNFSSFLISFSSLVSLAAGMDVEHPYHGVMTDPWWSCYFFIFMMFCIAVFTNTYAAILDEAFRYVRRKTEKRDFHPVETLAVSWIYEKLANSFGFKSTAFSSRKVKLREPLITFLKRNSTEAPNEAMTVDPVDGIPDRKSCSRDKVIET